MKRAKKRVTMKSYWGLLIILIAILSISSYFMINNEQIRAFSTIKKADFRLTAENKWSAESKKSYVELNWDNVNDISALGYKMYQSEDSKNWVLSPVNYGKSIKVLNVYPDKAESNTLKTWMDGLNLKSSNGQNLIQVTPVSLSQYCANPVGYLKKGSDYQYDVIMFGSWDANNKLDITQSGANATKDFLAAGRGVLFGHDTVYNGHSVFFKNFKSVIGIGTSKTIFTGSQKVKVVNDGYLMKYPFEMKNEVILTIPYAHNIELQQKSVGTTWLEFVNPSGAYPNPIPDDGTWRGGWYLKTNNNVGMIQTGHSNGASSLEERQIIANALYNLAQVSFNTNAQDQTVKDNQPPKLPTAEQKETSTITNMEINIDSIDQGKNYQWYIEANTKSSGIKKSDIVEETVTSNIAGYFYRIDTIKNTTLKETVVGYKDDFGRIPVEKYDLYVAPLGTTDTTSSSYDPTKDANLTTYDTKATIKNINGLTDGEKYLHIVAVDRANNVSEVKTVQIKELIKTFRVQEKYFDTDGNSLRGDTFKDIKKGANYSQTAIAITGYVPNSYQINNNTTVLDTKVTINNINNNYTVTYYYNKEITINLRQVNIGKLTEYTVPKQGYIQLELTAAGLASKMFQTTAYAGIIDGENTYTSVIIEKNKGYTGMTLQAKEAEYFKYVGYIATTVNSAHKQENKLTGTATLDVSKNSSFWVTIYMAPTLDEARSPGVYHWNYESNSLGTIK